MVINVKVGHIINEYTVLNKTESEYKLKNDVILIYLTIFVMIKGHL